MTAPKTGPTLFGRERELAEVRTRLEEAAQHDESNSGAVVLVHGDSGVGKSAFSSATISLAQGLGFDVYRTACEPFHEGMSYFPVRELVRQLAGGVATGAVIAEIFGADSPEAEMAAVSESVNADPASRREALVATFTNIILGRFRQPKAAPVLLFIDDLEHLDAGSADALICLVSRLDEGRVVLLGAYRTDLVSTKGHPLKPVISSARRMEGMLTMRELSSFAESDFAQLIAALLQAPAELSSSFYHRLFIETEGNPLFAREVLRTLRADHADGTAGSLSMRDGVFKYDGNVEKWAIPDTVEEVIASRLDLLDPNEREELEVAAVVGRRFLFDVFSGLMEAGEDELLRDLERFVSFDIIRELEDTDPTFEFSHGKIRDVLYNALSGLRRRRLHGQVAAQMEGILGAAIDRDALIGEHLFLAQKYPEAFPYLLRAARNAYATGAGGEAVPLYRKAIESTHGAILSDDDSRLSIALELVSALLSASENAAAGIELEKLVAENPPATLRVRALNLMGDVLLFDGEVEAALERYAESRSLAEELSDDEALCEVMCDLAELHGRQYERKSGIDPSAASRHYAAYVENVDGAYALQNKLPIGQLRARVLRNKAKLSRVSGDLAQAEVLYRDSIEYADARVGIHRFQIPYAKTLRLNGKPDEALAIVAKVLAWSSQVGSLRSRSIGLQYRATIRMTVAESAEELSAALDDATEAIQIHRSIGFAQGVHETELLLGELSMRMGRVDDAVAHFRAATGQRTLEDLHLVEVVARELNANGEEDRAAGLRTAYEPGSVNGGVEE